MDLLPEKVKKKKTKKKKKNRLLCERNENDCIPCEDIKKKMKRRKMEDNVLQKSDDLKETFALIGGKRKSNFINNVDVCSSSKRKSSEMKDFHSDNINTCNTFTEPDVGHSNYYNDRNFQNEVKVRKKKKKCSSLDKPVNLNKGNNLAMEIVSNDVSMLPPLEVRSFLSDGVSTCNHQITSPKIKEKKKKKNRMCNNEGLKNEVNSHEVLKSIEENDLVVIDETDDDVAKENNEKSDESGNISLDEETVWFNPLHYISGGRYRKKMKKLLEDEGIVQLLGKWSVDEMQTLEHNMEEFLAAHVVNDYPGLIIPKCKEDHTFRRKTQFVLHMCKGIQRTRNAISNKITIHFASFHLKGKFSAEERSDLLKLQKLHGNNWKEIGLLMNRNYTNLSTLHTHYGNSGNNGVWSKDEDERLIKAVDVYVKRGETLPWTTISVLVGTRTYCQCSRRWWYIQSKKDGLTKDIDSHEDIYTDENESIVFDVKETFLLISMIYESNIDDEYLIDWNNLSKHFNNVITPRWLKWKFGVISKEIPHSYMLEFEDVIEKLYEVYQRKIDNEDGLVNNDVADKEANTIILGDDNIYDKESMLSSEVICID